MKRVKEWRNSLKIGIFLFIVVCSFGIVGIPRTYSKFVIDGALVYKTKLYNMYTEYKMEPTLATMESAQFVFHFKPNKAIASDVVEWYDITIPDSCTFGQITTNASVSTVNKQTRRITYASGVDRSKTNEIAMTCTIDPKKEYVEFDAKINEVLDKENRKIAYIKYIYKEKYVDYLKRVEIGIENPKVIPNSENIYDIFMKWITAYAKSVNRESEILAYVKNTYPNKEALINPSNFNALLGFKISYDQKKDEYTFTILDNFVGYARMYHASIHSKLNGNEIPLYFSTTKRSVLDEAFRKYLDLYVYPGNVSAADKIYKYVSAKQGIYSVIFYGNKNISGLQLVSHNDKTLDTDLKLTKDRIITGANEQEGKPPEIAFSIDMRMATDFGNILTNQGYASGTTLRKNIYDMVKPSIIKNCTVKNNVSVTTPPEAFTDYFAQKNGNEYILIKVWSEGIDYNYVDFETMSVPSGMTISFENKTDTTLKVSIAHTTKDSVMDMLSYFNSYFKTSITEANVTVTSNTSNSYAIEYTISK